MIRACSFRTAHRFSMGVISLRQDSSRCCTSYGRSNSVPKRSRHHYLSSDNPDYNSPLLTYDCMTAGCASFFRIFSLVQCRRAADAAGLLTLPGAKAGLQKPAGYKATPGKPGFRNWVYRAQGVPGYRGPWVQGSLGTGVPGYRGPRVQGGFANKRRGTFLVFLARGTPRAKNTF